MGLMDAGIGAGGEGGGVDGSKARNQVPMTTTDSKEIWLNETKYWFCGKQTCMANFCE